jgi:beta-phosphoglucomutase-like phosphatase (HAD superfamily)
MAKMIKDHKVAPRRSAFFEDSEKNLAPAARLGMTTILVGSAAHQSAAQRHDQPRRPGRELQADTMVGEEGHQWSRTRGTGGRGVPWLDQRLSRRRK